MLGDTFDRLTCDNASFTLDTYTDCIWTVTIMSKRLQEWIASGHLLLEERNMMLKRCSSIVYISEQAGG